MIINPINWHGRASTAQNECTVALDIMNDIHST